MQLLLRQQEVEEEEETGRVDGSCCCVWVVSGERVERGEAGAAAAAAHAASGLVLLPVVLSAVGVGRCYGGRAADGRWGVGCWGSACAWCLWGADQRLSPPVSVMVLWVRPWTVFLLGGLLFGACLV